jgi:hypothetical protein
MFAVPASTLKGHKQSSGNLKQLALTIGTEEAQKQLEVSVSVKQLASEIKKPNSQHAMLHQQTRRY